MVVANQYIHFACWLIYIDLIVALGIVVNALYEVFGVAQLLTRGVRCRFFSLLKMIQYFLA